MSHIPSRCTYITHKASFIFTFNPILLRLHAPRNKQLDVLAIPHKLDALVPFHRLQPRLLECFSNYALRKATLVRDVVLGDSVALAEEVIGFAEVGDQENASGFEEGGEDACRRGYVGDVMICVCALGKSS